MGAPEDRKTRGEEPLASWFREVDPPAGAAVRQILFEFTSRGDRVPGRLWLPREESRAPFPLVLLQHGAGGSKRSNYLDAAGLPWAERGAAVASIDFPLHGERASAKLTEALLAGLATPAPLESEVARQLWGEFVRQAVRDLSRALDALVLRDEVDGARTAYAAFSLGSIVGARFCADDPRPRAAALALGGGGVGPPELDPACCIGRLAPRPVLLLNATHDERVPRAAAEALHAAAREPKEVVWVEGGHRDLRGRALKIMWRFLARALEVPSAD
jgi:fermentation-respiration switch protein FrsA (DUF1100 family)